MVVDVLFANFSGNIVKVLNIVLAYISALILHNILSFVYVALKEPQKLKIQFKALYLLNGLCNVRCFKHCKFPFKKAGY